MVELIVPQSPMDNIQSSLKELIEPISCFIGEVEQKLNSIGNQSDGILKDSSHYVVSGGGKRFRSTLLIFCASINPKILEDRHRMDQVVEVAAAMELIHSATLVHDDIIDRAGLRRQKPTAHIQFGEDLAILLGDFLYVTAFRMVAGTGDGPLTSWVAKTTQQMCEGEIDQLKYRFQSQLSLEDYLSFIEKKTACLIALSARSGAYLGQLPDHDVRQLELFGLYQGIAYQMMDDLLDMTGSLEQTGKTLRSDLQNGKITLPLILLCQKLNLIEKEKFHRDLWNGLNWDFILSLIQKYDIINQTTEFSNSYYLKALDSIKIFDLKTQNTLIQLSNIILNRKK